MPVVPGKRFWLVTGGIAMALLFEALWWRFPAAFTAREGTLYAQCAQIKSGADEQSAVALLSAYDSAFKTVDSHDPEMVYRLGAAQCVLRLDEHSGHVVEARGEKASPGFSPEERFQQTP